MVSERFGASYCHYGEETKTLAMRGWYLRDLVRVTVIGGRNKDTRNERMVSERFGASYCHCGEETKTLAMRGWSPRDLVRVTAIMGKKQRHSQ